MTTPDTINGEVERLSAKFHGIYQAEAKRQGDVRHKDAYADLPENIKEFDRVLAREVIRMMAQARLEEHKKCCRLIGQGYVPCCQEKPCSRRMDLERLSSRSTRPER